MDLPGVAPRPEIWIQVCTSGPEAMTFVQSKLLCVSFPLSNWKLKVHKPKLIDACVSLGLSAVWSHEWPHPLGPHWRETLNMWLIRISKSQGVQEWWALAGRTKIGELGASWLEVTLDMEWVLLWFCFPICEGVCGWVLVRIGAIHRHRLHRSVAATIALWAPASHP